MPTINRTFKITTDQNGAYSKQDVFDPPSPDFLVVGVSLAATLVSPADTSINGTFDVDAVDGSPQNEVKSFFLTTGERVSLGKWNLDGGKNIFILSGQTLPSRPNSEVELVVELSL